MNSRNEILKAVHQNQPPVIELPNLDFLSSDDSFLTETFINTLTKIGGIAVPVKTMFDVRSHIVQQTKDNDRIATTINALRDIGEFVGSNALAAHTLYNIDYAVIEAHFAVAENGAVWVTEKVISERVLPFICQHLAVVVSVGDIVADMHRAYDKIGAGNYGFGTFIAGPSKTADIEQSLVIGAHGPRSLTVFFNVRNFVSQPPQTFQS